MLREGCDSTIKCAFVDNDVMRWELPFCEMVDKVTGVIQWQWYLLVLYLSRTDLHDSFWQIESIEFGN